MLECDEGCVFVDGDCFPLPERGCNKLFELGRVRCDLLDLQAVGVRMGARFRAFEFAFAGHFNIVVVEFAEAGVLGNDVFLSGVDGVDEFEGGLIGFVAEVIGPDEFFEVVDVTHGVFFHLVHDALEFLAHLDSMVDGDDLLLPGLCGSDLG